MAALNDQLMELLQCPVCFDRLKLPIETCENGHGICKNCRKSMEACGICRKKFTSSPNTLLNKVIEILPMKCKYSTQGCVKSSLIGTIDEHEKICYYRKESCLPCALKIDLPEMNEHFIICKKLTAKSERTFHSIQSVDYDMTQMRDSRYYFAVYITNIKTFFLQRFIRNENKLFFCIQYLGKDQENANKYKYDVKMDQGMPPPNQSYYSFSGLCVPYFYSKDEMIKQKGVVELNLTSIFLTDDYISSKKITIEAKLYELS